jgi:hypothetical protein
MLVEFAKNVGYVLAGLLGLGLIMGVIALGLYLGGVIGAGVALVLAMAALVTVLEEL